MAYPLPLTQPMRDAIELAFQDYLVFSEHTGRTFCPRPYEDDPCQSTIAALAKRGLIELCPDVSKWGNRRWRLTLDGIGVYYRIEAVRENDRASKEARSAQ